jgi:hypothetical protein
MENLFDMHDFIFNSIVGPNSMFNTNKPKPFNFDLVDLEYDRVKEEEEAENEFKHEYFK